MSIEVNNKSNKVETNLFGRLSDFSTSNSEQYNNDGFIDYNAVNIDKLIQRGEYLSCNCYSNKNKDENDHFLPYHLSLIANNFIDKIVMLPFSHGIGKTTAICKFVYDELKYSNTGIVITKTKQDAHNLYYDIFSLLAYDNRELFKYGIDNNDSNVMEEIINLFSKISITDDILSDDCTNYKWIIISADELKYISKLVRLFNNSLRDYVFIDDLADIDNYMYNIPISFSKIRKLWISLSKLLNEDIATMTYDRLYMSLRFMLNKKIPDWLLKDVHDILGIDFVSLKQGVSDIIWEETFLYYLVDVVKSSLDCFDISRIYNDQNIMDSIGTNVAAFGYTGADIEYVWNLLDVVKNKRYKNTVIVFNPYADCYLNIDPDIPRDSVVTWNELRSFHSALECFVPVRPSNGELIIVHKERNVSVSSFVEKLLKDNEFEGKLLIVSDSLSVPNFSSDISDKVIVTNIEEPIFSILSENKDIRSILILSENRYTVYQKNDSDYSKILYQLLSVIKDYCGLEQNYKIMIDSSFGESLIDDIAKFYNFDKNFSSVKADDETSKDNSSDSKSNSNIYDPRKTLYNMEMSRFNTLNLDTVSATEISLYGVTPRVEDVPYRIRYIWKFEDSNENLRNLDILDLYLRIKQFYENNLAVTEWIYSFGDKVALKFNSCVSNIMMNKIDIDLNTDMTLDVELLDMSQDLHISGRIKMCKFYER